MNLNCYNWLQDPGDVYNVAVSVLDVGIAGWDIKSRSFKPYVSLRVS